MTLVATQVKRRRGTTAENNAFTGAEGEITVDLTTHELRVHDGSTVGGHTIPTKNYGYSKAESDDLLSNKANIALDNITNAGKEVCANMGMPSGRFTNLTVGVSGTQYTAPADGYFEMRATSTGSGNYFEILSSNGLDSLVHSGGVGLDLGVFVPVSKGQTITIYYSTNTPSLFKFIYANGAQ